MHNIYVTLRKVGWAVYAAQAQNWKGYQSVLVSIVIKYLQVIDY